MTKYYHPSADFRNVSVVSVLIFAVRIKFNKVSSFYFYLSSYSIFALTQFSAKWCQISVIAACASAGSMCHYCAKVLFTTLRRYVLSFAVEIQFQISIYRVNYFYYFNWQLGTISSRIKWFTPVNFWQRYVEVLPTAFKQLQKKTLYFLVCVQNFTAYSRSEEVT